MNIHVLDFSRFSMMFYEIILFKFKCMDIIYINIIYIPTSMDYICLVNKCIALFYHNDINSYTKVPRG